MAQPAPIIDALTPKLLGEFADEFVTTPLLEFRKLVHPNLWWSSISGLQKAIRRGAEDVAVDTALMLYVAQGKRLLRRLAVIAVEDVCFGNFPAVQVAVQYAHTGIPGNGQEALRRLAGLVRALAGGVKDRSACELLVATSYDLDATTAAKLLKMPPEMHLKIYTDRKAEVRARVLSGRILAGALKVDGKQVAKAHPDLALEAVDEMTDNAGLLATVESLLALGNELSGFAIALPLVWGRLQRVKPKARDNPLTPSVMINGNLSPAYDMHTMEGKRTLALFVIANKPLRVALRSRGYDPKAVLGNLVFMAEGAQVDRELAYTFGDELDKLNQEAQCRKIGVDPADLPQLLELVRAGIPLLNQLREKVVKSFNYSPLNTQQQVLI